MVTTLESFHIDTRVLAVSLDGLDELSIHVEENTTLCLEGLVTTTSLDRSLELDLGSLRETSLTRRREELEVLTTKTMNLTTVEEGLRVTLFDHSIGMVVVTRDVHGLERRTNSHRRRLIREQITTGVLNILAGSFTLVDNFFLGTTRDTRLGTDRGPLAFRTLHTGGLGTRGREGVGGTRQTSTLTKLGLVLTVLTGESLGVDAVMSNRAFDTLLGLAQEVITDVTGVLSGNTVLDNALLILTVELRAAHLKVVVALVIEAVDTGDILNKVVGDIVGGPGVESGTGGHGRDESGVGLMTEEVSLVVDVDPPLDVSLTPLDLVHVLFGTPVKSFDIDGDVLGVIFVGTGLKDLDVGHDAGSVGTSERKNEREDGAIGGGETVEGEGRRHGTLASIGTRPEGDITVAEELAGPGFSRNGAEVVAVTRTTRNERGRRGLSLKATGSSLSSLGGSADSVVDGSLLLHAGLVLLNRRGAEATSDVARVIVIVTLLLLLFLLLGETARVGESEGGTVTLKVDLLGVESREEVGVSVVLGDGSDVIVPFRKQRVDRRTR